MSVFFDAYAGGGLDGFDFEIWVGREEDDVGGV